jgi:small nuclear ribonucleoprotein (snRNP)-like protein
MRSIPEHLTRESPMNESDRLKGLLGRIVVIDTDGPNLYAGTLASVDEWFYELTEADVHDSTSTSTTRDVYILNVKRYGIKRNRDRVLVRHDRVVSLSALDEVTAY